jgi:pimeloyl-ACP methyl ester carboxylesterase
MKSPSSSEEVWGTERDERETRMKYGLMAGYGQSDKPHGSSTHIEYSKRVMADDMVQLMYVFSLVESSLPLRWDASAEGPVADIRDKLGHSQFSIAGHDRGGRVAHRMTLDHPGKVKRLMVLDIAPTLGAFEGMGHKSVRVLFFFFSFLSSNLLPSSLTPFSYTSKAPRNHHFLRLNSIISVYPLTYFTMYPLWTS